MIMQRTKRISAFLAALFLTVCLCLPAFAAAPLVRDEYGLFDSDTYNALEAAAEAASDGHDCDVYFLTVDSIGEDAQYDYGPRSFAKDYYLENSLGSGSSQSGILFMIALGSRKYVTITYGRGITIFTDYRIGQIEDAVVPLLSSGDYASAAQTYIGLCADTLDYYAEHGEPIDIPAQEDDGGGLLVTLLIVIGVPLGIAAIVCGILYSRMKTAKIKTEANDYIGSGLQLRVRQDNYTHTTRTQVYDPPAPPPQEHSSSGGSTVDSSGFGGSSGGSF